MGKQKYNTWVSKPTCAYIEADRLLDIKHAPKQSQCHGLSFLQGVCVSLCVASVYEWKCVCGGSPAGLLLTLLSNAVAHAVCFRLVPQCVRRVGSTVPQNQLPSTHLLHDLISMTLMKGRGLLDDVLGLMGLLQSERKRNQLFLQ